jgi:hypothetical protein
MLICRRRRRTKYETVVNLKQQSIVLPTSLLARADEAIDDRRCAASEAGTSATCDRPR